jgi:purine-nucleoside phosphorylase
MENTTLYLRERVTRAPAVVLVLGSGMGSLADDIADPVRLPYADIPGFPRSTVEGHPGELVVGILEGVEVAAMAGRFHLYEGWEAREVVAPIRALAALGAGMLLVTNAAGGIRAGMRPGDLMLISDHINLTGRNPLRGAPLPGEERFPDMSGPYDAGLRREIAAYALEEGIALDEGVYAGLLGPSYETPAEVRMLRQLGADAVGMSTVAEVIAARALGMRVSGISCITNAAAGLGAAALSHEEVLAVGASARDTLARLLRGILPRIAPMNLPTEA